MTYENKQPNDKPGYGKVLPFRRPGNEQPIGAGYRGRDGGNAVKHCPTCQCGAHATGGLENALYGAGLPGGAQPVMYQITIYALPQELLRGYDLSEPAMGGISYGKPGYGKKDSKAAQERYPSNKFDKRRAA